MRQSGGPKHSEEIARAIDLLQRLANTNLKIDHIISLSSPADQIQLFSNRMFNSPTTAGYDSDLSALQAVVAAQVNAGASSAVINTAINTFMQDLWARAGRAPSAFQPFDNNQSDQIVQFFAPGSASQPIWSCGATGPTPPHPGADGSPVIDVGPFELAVLYNLIFTELDLPEHKRFYDLIRIGRAYKKAEDLGDESGMADQRTQLVNYLTAAFNGATGAVLSSSPALNFTQAQLDALLDGLKEPRFKDLAPVAAGSAY